MFRVREDFGSLNVQEVRLDPPGRGGSNKSETDVLTNEMSCLVQR